MDAGLASTAAGVTPSGAGPALPLGSPSLSAASPRFSDGDARCLSLAAAIASGVLFGLVFPTTALPRETLMSFIPVAALLALSGLTGWRVATLMSTLAYAVGGPLLASAGALVIPGAGGSASLVTLAYAMPFCLAFALLLLWGAPLARPAASIPVALFGAATIGGVGAGTVWLGALAFGGQGASTWIALPRLAVLLAAPLLAWLGRLYGRAISSPAALLGAWRDSFFRILLLVAGLAAALWLGGALQSLLMRSSAATPLEGLAGGAGWAVALPVLGLLLWAVVAWPRRLFAARMQGRLDPGSATEILLAPPLAGVAALLMLGVDGWLSASTGGGLAGLLRLGAGHAPELDGFGHQCALALLAAGTASSVRWWASRRDGRESPAAVPLWILLAEEAGPALQQCLARAARLWVAGPVTQLSLPAFADEIAGDHLRGCVQLGNEQRLFPLRRTQFDDWRRALPAQWPALPLRELYAPVALWPALVSDLIEPEARILLLRTRSPDGSPDRAGLDRLENALPAPLRHSLHAARGWTERLVRRQSENFVELVVLSHSDAARLRPGDAGFDIAALPGERHRAPDLEKALIALQPPQRVEARRRVLLLAAAPDLDLAGRMAALLQGRRDAEGRVVTACVLPEGRSPRVQWARIAANAGLWRVAAAWRASVSEGDGPGQRFHQIGLRLVAALIRQQAVQQFDVVDIDTRADAAGKLTWKSGHPTALLGAARALRLTTVQAEAAAMTLRAARVLALSNVVQLPAGETPQGQAAFVARLLLEREVRLKLGPIEFEVQQTMPAEHYERSIEHGLAAASANEAPHATTSSVEPIAATLQPAPDMPDTPHAVPLPQPTGATQRLDAPDATPSPEPTASAPPQAAPAGADTTRSPDPAALPDLEVWLVASTVLVCAEGVTTQQRDTVIDQLLLAYLAVERQQSASPQQADAPTEMREVLRNVGWSELSVERSNARVGRTHIKASMSLVDLLRQIDAAGLRKRRRSSEAMDVALRRLLADDDQQPALALFERFTETSPTTLRFAIASLWAEGPGTLRLTLDDLVFEQTLPDRRRPILQRWSPDSLSWRSHAQMEHATSVIDSTRSNVAVHVTEARPDHVIALRSGHPIEPLPRA